MPTATTPRDRLDFLVRKTGRDEVEIVARAVEAGVAELYRRQVADAYLAGDISRQDAAADLGEEMIADLDYALKAVERDVRWGLRRAPVAL